MRIFDNLLYKLVALLVAVLLWVSAQGVNDIEQSLDLRVAYVDLPEGLVVVDQSATDVNVRVRASRGLRLVSLGFLLLTVGKVFLYDLGQLTGLYRIMSFLALGLSLIVVSLLYQRFVRRSEVPA